MIRSSTGNDDWLRKVLNEVVEETEAEERERYKNSYKPPSKTPKQTPEKKQNLLKPKASQPKPIESQLKPMEYIKAPLPSEVDWGGQEYLNPVYPRKKEPTKVPEKKPAPSKMPKWGRF